MRVLIDDIRNYDADIIARTPSAGKQVLQHFHNQIEWLIIDHDLGKDENGNDILKWAIQNNCLPKRVQLISANPVGRKNMVDTLVFDADYVTYNNIDFKK